MSEQHYYGPSQGTQNLMTGMKVAAVIVGAGLLATAVTLLPLSNKKNWVETPIAVTLPDGNYTISHTVPLEMVQEFAKKNPDRKVIGAGSMLQLHVENGQAHVRTLITNSPKMD